MAKRGRPRTHSLRRILDDFAKIVAPTLILVGDRDEFCSVEEGVSTYRALPRGELGVIPGIEHAITPLVCTVALDFLRRHAREPG
jgi:pimeloyl-ACP methyl ester carboxylesterase